MFKYTNRVPNPHEKTVVKSAFSMIKIEDFCIFPSCTIQDLALKLNALKVKTVYVISEDRRLLGSITDGDLRRGIIDSIDANESVEKIMNKSPKFIVHSDKLDKQKAIQIHTGTHSLPVVDHNSHLVDIIFPLESEKVKLRNNTVVIMAGGFGKRLLPLTKDIPKPMLKLGNKPILEHIIENFVSQGFKNFVISTYYKAEQISGWDRVGSYG